LKVPSFPFLEGEEGRKGIITTLREAIDVGEEEAGLDFRGLLLLSSLIIFSPYTFPSNNFPYLEVALKGITTYLELDFFTSFPSSGT
jgi:hypothetical protein